MMIDVITLCIVFHPMVCILKPLRFIALMALCAFAIRFCMCAYVFGDPGWIWAPRYGCAFRRALVLGGYLVILRFVFLVPCLGGFLICLG